MPPLSAILIGLALAWAGNIHGLIQAKEISLLGKEHLNGIEHYLYVFQLGVLVLLITILFWGVAAAGLFGMPKETRI